MDLNAVRIFYFWPASVIRKGYYVGPCTDISFHSLRQGYFEKNQVAQIFQKSNYRKTYLAIIMLVSDSAEMRNYISISAELATFNHYVCAQFPAQWGTDFHLALPDTVTWQIKMSNTQEVDNSFPVQPLLSLSPLILSLAQQTPCYF